MKEFSPDAQKIIQESDERIERIQKVWEAACLAELVKRSQSDE
jgi:hypothetical protein